MSPTTDSHLPARFRLRALRRALPTRLVALVLLVIGAGLSPASASAAGTYDVFLYNTPDGRQVPVDMPDPIMHGYYTQGDNRCTSEFCGMILGLGQLDRATGEYVRATLNSPLPIVMADVTRTAQVVDGTSLDDNGTPYVAFRAGDTVIDNCAYYLGCRSLGLAGSSHAIYSGPGVNSLTWEVGCGGTATGRCRPPASGTIRAFLIVTGIHLRLEDEGIPSLGVKSGSAISAGTHAKVESVQVTAADFGSGVYRVEAYLDGKLAGATGPGGRCVDRQLVSGGYSFDAITACPQWDVPLTVPVDTTVVPDGTHVLRLVAIDAAGNRSQADERKIDIDNVPAPKATSVPTLGSPAFPNALRPGDVLTAANGTWTGAGLTFAYRWQRYDASTWSDIKGATASSYTLTKDDIDKQIRVVVTGTNSEGTAEAISEPTGVVKSGATVTVSSLGPTSSLADPAAPQLVLDREQRSVQVKYGAKIVVTGKLVDSGGAPIADADVDVFEQVSVVGSPWKRIATIKTDSQGGYAFTPTTLGSRVLRFAYSATRDSGDYRATREVVIGVTAGMDVRAVHRSIPARGVIRLHGRVLAQPLPQTGTWVEVQVLDAGVWRTIATCRTSATGRWSYKHRVRQSSHVSFAFRARLRQYGDVPALESKSSTVKVRVR